MKSFTDLLAEPLPYLTAVFIFILYTYYSTQPSIPHLNPRKYFELTDARPKKEFLFRSREMAREWFGANPDKPARLTSDVGEVIVLAPHMANVIRNDSRLSFSRLTSKAFHVHLPGFEGFVAGSGDSELLQAVISKYLTKCLKKVTEPLVEETSLALSELFTENTEWHTIPLRETILPLISRISSRVFLGEELCRSESWLRVTQEYTITGFAAAKELRLWPAPLRYIVHWFLPACRKARAQVKEARQIIRKVLEKRRKQKLDAQAEGREIFFDDAIEWFEKESKGRPHDPAACQLSLSLAAIHNTSDLLCQVLSDLAQRPEMIKPLRQEIATVCADGQWQNSTLYNMKLLDSVIKESQRIKPAQLLSMLRLTLDKVELPDNTIVPKNSIIAVSSHRMWDPEVYQSPDVWDGYRFYNMRKIPGKEKIAQLASTSPEHLGFGHGQHACPGRFFAANEVKISLVQILLQYDWKLPHGTVPAISIYGFSMSSDPFITIEIRRRQNNSVTTG